MPAKTAPKCIQCEKNESNLWRTCDLGVFCQECFEKNEKSAEAKEAEAAEAELARINNKKTRGQRGHKAASNTNNKTRGRRCIFKRHAIKTPAISAVSTTRDSIFHDNIYFQKGDIVSLMDEEDNVFYAQIKGFLVDTYLEKSAFITWLLPSTLSPPPNDTFDPCTYVIGYDESFPRKLDTMEFVMHAPIDYWKMEDSPYSTKHSTRGQDKFIWSNLD